MNSPYLSEARDEEVREQPAADVPTVNTSTSRQPLPGSRRVLLSAVPRTMPPPQSFSVVPDGVYLLTVLLSRSPSFVFANNICKLGICKSYSSLQRHAAVPTYANAKRNVSGNYGAETGKRERYRVLRHWWILVISPWRDVGRAFSGP